MVLQNHYDPLIPLTTLKTRVDQFSQLYYPDFVYSDTDTRGLTFRVIKVPDTEDTYRVGYTTEESGHGVPHLLSNWARSQLLSHLGTREKWFSRVSHELEAAELNDRRHTLHQRMFRTMRFVDDNGVRLLRGLVSSSYGDIPDTLIMGTLVKTLPEAQALRSFSGYTERAFYTYVITGEPVEIPGTQFKAHPGLVVKNSEVGYSSLWLIPKIYFPRQKAVIVFEEHCLLRKTHRGSMDDMMGAFEEALSELAGLWGDLEARIRQLSSIRYADEEVAVLELRKLILASKGQSTKMFAYRCEQHYRGQNHATHTGQTVYDAILWFVRSSSDRDKGYDNAAIAGAVLLHLT